MTDHDPPLTGGGRGEWGVTPPEDPEGAIEEEVAREGSTFFGCGAQEVEGDAHLSMMAAWREQWENASDEKRAEWFRRGFLDEVGSKIADGIERDPEVTRHEGHGRRVLDFGELSGEWLNGYRLVVTVALQRHKPGMRDA